MIKQSRCTYMNIFLVIKYAGNRLNMQYKLKMNYKLYAY